MSLLCHEFACTPSALLDEDVQLCEDIAQMRRYARARSIEKEDVKAVSAEDRRFMIILERQARGENDGGSR